MPESELFIVVSQPRSGTTYFTNFVMSAHPQAKCWDELFGNVTSEHPFLRKIGLPRYGGGDVIRYLAEYRERVAASYGVNRVGFKLFAQHLDATTYRTLLEHSSHRIILLFRRQVLRAVVSNVIARATEQFHPRSRKDFEPFVADLTLVSQAIARHHRSIAETRQILARARRAFFELEYNQIFDLRVVNRAYEFIGLSPIDALPLWGNVMNDARRYRLIRNIDDIERSFASAENGSLFSGPEPGPDSIRWPSSV